MGSFGNICRLCCREEINLIDIFNFFGYKIQIAKKIEKYLSIEVCEQDSLPQSICNQCLTKLNEHEEFITSCYRAQQLLAELHLQTMVAKQKAAEGELVPPESGGEDVTSLVPALLLQEELSRKQSEVKQAIEAVSTVRTALQVKRNLEMMRKRKRKGFKRPVKAVRRSCRRTNNASYAEENELYGCIVKTEPLDQDPNNTCRKDDSSCLKNCAQDEKICNTLQLEPLLLGTLFSAGKLGILDDDSSFPNLEKKFTGPEEPVCSIETDDQHTAVANCNTEANNCNTINVNCNPEATTFDSEKDSCNPDNVLDRAAATPPLLERPVSTETTDEHDVDEHVREPIIKIEVTPGDDSDDEIEDVTDGVSNMLGSMDDASGSTSDEPPPEELLRPAEDPVPLTEMVRCSICEAPFLALSSLLLHHRMVHAQDPAPEGPLMCVYCQQVFRDLNRLTLHTSDEHSDRVKLQGPLPTVRDKPRRELRHRCDVCRKGFSTAKGLTLHKPMHAKRRDKTSRLFGRRGYGSVRSNVRCGMCKATMAGMPQLRAHLAEQHADCEDCPAPFLCPLCDKAYSSSSSLVHHRAKHGVKTHKCPICYKAYHPKYLKKHMVVHQVARPFACELCDKDFKDIEGLKHHKLKHRPDDQKYKVYCDVCGQRFINRGALNVHLKVVHQGLKEYQCRHCDRSFGSKATAEIHERIHTGEKPFCCDVCGWKCNSKGKLKVHVRVHSDNKPHECKVCGKRTRSKNEMRQHELIHTDIKPNPCKFCDKRFRSTSQLKIHTRQHTGERPYKCPSCTRTFCDFANYSKHMHRVHKKEFEDMQRSKPNFEGVQGRDQGAGAASAESASAVVDNNNDELDRLPSPGASAGAASVSAAAKTNHSPLVEKQILKSSSILGSVANACRLEVQGEAGNVVRESNHDSSYQSLALQLIRPQQQQQSLLQLHIQSQQQQQQHLSSLVQHDLQQQQQQHHIHHQQQDQQQQKSQQQQLLEQLLPLPLPPPPQAHQHHPPSLIPSTLPHSSVVPNQSSMINAQSSSSSGSVSSSSLLQHHPSPLPHQHTSHHTQPSLYPTSPLQQQQQQQHQQHQHQDGVSGGPLAPHIAPPHMQQQQLHPHMQHLTHQYHTSFPGAHIAQPGSYDPFRLPL